MFPRFRRSQEATLPGEFRGRYKILKREWYGMYWKPTRDITGKPVRVYRMPEEVAGGSEEARRAWALGVYAGAVGGGAFETKCVGVKDAGKTYERVEIHKISPQMYAVLDGSIAVPIAPDLDPEHITFCRVDSREAIIVDPEVWRGAPSGIDVPAMLLFSTKEPPSLTQRNRISQHLSKWGLPDRSPKRVRGLFRSWLGTDRMAFEEWYV